MVSSPTTLTVGTQLSGCRRNARRDRQALLPACGRLTGDEAEALCGGVFFERRETGSARGGLPGPDFYFAEGQSGLELGANEVEFCGLGKDGFETLGGLDGFP